MLDHPNPLYTAWIQEKNPLNPKDLAKATGISVPHIYRMMFYYPQQLARASLYNLLRIENATGINLVEFTLNNLKKK